MGALLAKLLPWILASTAARIFAGVGLSVVSQVFLTDYANDMLNALVSQVNGMPGNIGQLFLLMGFGSFLSIVGTAVITRAAIVSSAKIFGINITA